MLIENGYITVQPPKNKNEPPINPDKCQEIKNWTITADIDKIEISGNVFNSCGGMANGSFCKFSPAYAEELNANEFIVRTNTNFYILKYSEELKNNYVPNRVQPQNIIEYYQNNTVISGGLADAVLSEGDELKIPGVGYSEKTIRKGKRENGEKYFTYRYSAADKALYKCSPEKRQKIGKPVFRLCGRDFYSCFDRLGEIMECIISDNPFNEYSQKIREIFTLEIGEDEKRSLMEILYCTVRYYASPENYSEAVSLLKEYGLNYTDFMCRNSTNFIFDLFHANAPEVKREIFKRLSFRPDLNVFSIIPFMLGNILNRNNADNAVSYAVERRQYNMLKAIYRIFGIKN
ncbi:MAG: hypothetical protein NC192_08420 [Muribaculaceae bacterium]|nr:hypothetical protein [Muribaculaceae bacterium]